MYIYVHVHQEQYIHLCLDTLTFVEVVYDLAVVFDIVWADQHDTQSLLHGSGRAATPMNIILKNIDI